MTKLHKKEYETIDKTAFDYWLIKANARQQFLASYSQTSNTLQSIAFTC